MRAYSGDRRWQTSSETEEAPTEAVALILGHLEVELFEHFIQRLWLECLLHRLGVFSVLPAHAAFEILWRFLFAHLTPPDAQVPGRHQLHARSAVVARCVAPNAPLIVPVFAIAAQRLEAFAARSGVEPAN